MVQVPPHLLASVSATLVLSVPLNEQHGVPAAMLQNADNAAVSRRGQTPGPQSVCPAGSAQVSVDEGFYSSGRRCAHPEETKDQQLPCNPPNFCRGGSSSCGAGLEEACPAGRYGTRRTLWAILRWSMCPRILFEAGALPDFKITALRVLIRDL